MKENDSIFSNFNEMIYPEWLVSKFSSITKEEFRLYKIHCVRLLQVILHFEPTRRHCKTGTPEVHVHQHVHVSTCQA